MVAILRVEKARRGEPPGLIGGPDFWAKVLPAKLRVAYFEMLFFLGHGRSAKPIEPRPNVVRGWSRRTEGS